MKTAIVAPCYIDGEHRLQRNKLWLEFIDTTGVKYDNIILFDNASHTSYTDQLKHPNLKIERYFQHLPRTGTLEYPYCWRVLDDLKRLFNHYDKIIYMDTDFYPLSIKFVDFINKSNTGWVTTYSHKYGFPEAAFWILNKDSFNLLGDFPIPDYYHYNGKVLEDLLPFTDVRKDFTGDRYGEFEDKSQKPDMDFYAQCEQLRH